MHGNVHVRFGGRLPGKGPIYRDLAGQPTLPTATVDRLLHHAHLVLTEGTSLRLAEATAGKGVTPLT